MKIRAKYLLCITLALILIVLPSCSMFWSSNLTYSGGQMLDDELMSSIRAELIGGETTVAESGDTNDTTEDEIESGEHKDETESGEHKDETESGEYNDETESGEYKDETESGKSDVESSTKYDSEKSEDFVYWTKSGGVYHLYGDCGYIKSSSDIISGTSEEALEAGKLGVCSRCQSRKDKEQKADIINH